MRAAGHTERMAGRHASGPDDPVQQRPVAELRHRNDPEVVRRLLSTPARWAVVGLSANRARVAHEIGGYLQGLGMQVVPVHPRAEPAHDEPGYPRLADVPGPVDVVDVFVNSRSAGRIVDEAIAIGAKAVWMQVDVVDQAAAQRAKDAGLLVVMDTCPAIEAPRLGVA